MKKYYNIELDKEPAREFINILKEHKIKYESSSCYNVIHIELYASEEEAGFLNKMLDIIL